MDCMTKKYPNECPDHTGVKLSGDGIFIGKRIHVVNLTVRIIYGQYHSEEPILVMVRAPENMNHCVKCSSISYSRCPTAFH